jgi:hypothetical protein
MKGEEDGFEDDILHFTLYVMKTSLKSAMSWKIA